MTAVTRPLAAGRTVWYSNRDRSASPFHRGCQTLHESYPKGADSKGFLCRVEEVSDVGRGEGAPGDEAKPAVSIRPIDDTCPE